MMGKMELQDYKHFNQIINEECTFIDTNGTEYQTSVYGAAQNAMNAGEALLVRVKAHQINKNIGAYEADKQQYDLLQTLATRISGVVEFLKQDIGSFDESKVAPGSQVISTKADVERVITDLTRTKDQMTNAFLSSGTVFWYLPDYLNDLKRMKDERTKV